MSHIKCTRNTSYGIGKGKSKNFEAGKIYEVGKDKDLTAEIASQMKGNRSAVDYVKPTKKTLVEENKSSKPDENKGSDAKKPTKGKGGTK
ncbi:hypothetical protein KAR91_88485 [Candidatus Pacearchaeota archaeon]|nr:hypothetical protein [Candidatus Pacearchaeota archaeon]